MVVLAEKDTGLILKNKKIVLYYMYYIYVFLKTSTLIIFLRMVSHKNSTPILNADEASLFTLKIDSP